MKQYVTFFEVENDEHKTRVWTVHPVASPGTEIGTVKWYAPWRRYTFKPHPNTTFDAKCLTQIAEFLDQAMAHHAALKSEARL